MTGLPKLTKSDVRRLATAQSFQRGEDYVYAVFDTQRCGDTLTAQVEGSQYEPYHVTVTLDQAGIQDLYCTCPYDWGGICKHIVAVLLTYIQEPDTFTVRIEPSELLADLDAKTLRAVLTDLLKRYPKLQDEVEAQLAVHQVQTAPPEAEKSHKRHSPLDPAPIRRRVINILHSLDRMPHSESYWAVSGMVDQLSHVLQEAQDFLNGDDAESALVILQVLGEEVIETYPEFEYAEVDVAEFIDDMSAPLAEALLARDLSSDRRQEWKKKLTRWENHLDEYGVYDVTYAPLAALRGWDATVKDDEEEFVADLTDAQLNILERRGETDQFLALALKTGRHLRYALKLVDLEMAQQAAHYAQIHFTQASNALILAEHLRETNNLENALNVAKRGLDLEGHKHRLGTWLADVAAGLGQNDLALRARIVAFEEQPSLEGYQAVQEQADNQWPNLQPRLLESARHFSHLDQVVEILLYEGLTNEAIAIAERETWNYHLLAKVVDGTIDTHPNWAIRVSQQQAEDLINKVQTKYYSAAVRWLEKVRAAYISVGRNADWQTYLADLRQRHHRKRTLMGMLKGMN